MKKLVKYFWYIVNYFRYRNHIFLIYQLGKVGSSSVYKNLRRKLPFSTIFHLHFLSEEWLERKLPSLNEYYHDNIKLGKDALKCIASNSGKRVKIITLVREPVDRDISDIFENWLPRYEGVNRIDLKTEKLINDFKNNDFSYTLSWFDSEFLNFTGIDIYSLEFDKERGYSIYNLPKFDLLCIKLEKLNNCYRQAFLEFLNLKFEKFERSRLAINKENYDQYREMVTLFKMDREKLKSVYQSKYVRHFYTQSEIEAFLEKWSD